VPVLLPIVIDSVVWLFRAVRSTPEPSTAIVNLLSSCGSRSAPTSASAALTMNTVVKKIFFYCASNLYCLKRRSIAFKAAK